jgi:hypothetical protein
MQRMARRGRLSSNVVSHLGSVTLKPCDADSFDCITQQFESANEPYIHNCFEPLPVAVKGDAFLSGVTWPRNASKSVYPF